MKQWVFPLKATNIAQHGNIWNIYHDENKVRIEKKPLYSLFCIKIFSHFFFFTWKRCLYVRFTSRLKSLENRNSNSFIYKCCAWKEAFMRVYILETTVGCPSATKHSNLKLCSTVNWIYILLVTLKWLKSNHLSISSPVRARNLF